MKLFKTLWGVEGADDPTTWEKTFRRIKADGFDGIEICVGPMFFFQKDEALGKKLLQQLGLEMICQLHTCGIPHTSTKLVDHIASFKELVILAASYQPTLINCHSGRDSFTLAESIQFFKEVEAFISENKDKISCPVVHETHRTRILYSPFVYRDLMAANGLPATMKINADLSHWAVVSERLMDETADDDFWPAVLADVASRAGLIHARVGGSQTPQIMDPRDPDPECQQAVAAHMKWWATIVSSMRERGVEVLIEPEHGGDPYLARAPFTRMALVDVWQINTELGKKLRASFDTK